VVAVVARVVALEQVVLLVVVMVITDQDQVDLVILLPYLLLKEMQGVHTLLVTAAEVAVVLLPQELYLLVW
tara:strand:+ start:384 stop:596 length:213 start_codon:yes stop_codon:yes gene_type:complete